MKRSFLLALICIAAIGANAQENSVILRGRVFAPDGTPVRNREGSLHLRLDLLRDKAVISQAVNPGYQPIDHRVVLAFNVKTDENGVFQSEQNRDYLRREEGKRALVRIYMLVPEVGAIMTRRFFWTVGEPLPDLHLKPLAKLKVEFVHPTLNIRADERGWVRRADDYDSEWQTEWVPADEWLTVSGISVKLKPGEEKHLLIPQMPLSRIPVHLTVRLPYGEESRFQPQKRLPPLLVGGNLLRGYYGIWEGLAMVNRKEPFSFVFVPPMHLLRIPTEQIEMKPLLDIVPSLDYLVPYPITEIECNLKMDDSRAKSLFSEWRAFRFNQRGWKQWKEVISLLSLYEESEALLPRAEHEGLDQWLWRPSYEDLPRRFWVTQWTPLIARVSVREKDRRYTLAFPVKGGEAAKRKYFTVVFPPPEQEQPKVSRLKTGQLKGTVRTLDGKPVAEIRVIASFVEDKLVERLTEEGEVDFLTETDEQGNFTFTDLPEGKYDLFVLSINPWWVGCVEAIVKAGKTTTVNLVGYFEQEQKPTRRRITLRLQFPDGTPVAGYLVNAISTFLVSGLTDEQGRISLEVEGEQLEIKLVEIDGVPNFSLRIHPEQSEFTVTVPIPLRGMVEGCVLLPDGSTSDKVLVTAWKLREGWDYISPHSIYRLRVLPDGRFFCSLLEGTYIFKAEPMLPNLSLNSTYCAPSLSPPVVVKAGEVTKVTWQLKPATSRYLEFPFWQRFPPIGTLHIRTEYYNGQIHEAKFDLPMPVAIVEPLGKLDDNEDMLWDRQTKLSPGFYRLTSWGWRGEEFKSVVRISESTERLTLTPPSASPTLTVTGRVLLPNNAPASNAIVALYDPDQEMKRWATICDENGQFSLSVQLPSVEILEQQHLDTLLPNSKNELWLIAWKIGYGHSLIRRLLRPRRYESRTVDVGALTLSQSERVEGQVIDESGNPVPFVGVVMLPIDTNLFVPKPDKETLLQELTAFEDFNVGSIPHAQADHNGRFCVEGLRRGQYLLVASVRLGENGDLKELMAYQIVNVPSDKIKVRLERLRGSLTAEPSGLTNALPFAEVEIETPCWRYHRFHPRLRADEFGRFKAESVPRFENAPILVRIMHRDGMITSFSPPEDWRYVVQLRP